MSKPTPFLIFCIMVLAACAPPIPVPDDPEIEAARSACAQWRKLDEKYTGCITNEAVAILNPDICRLTNIYIDDFCLQMVYEAADDDSICEQLYLESVQANCYYFHAQPERDSPRPTPTPISSPTTDELGTIAYVLDGDIWIKRLPDGEAQRITDDGVNGEPLWSASGEWLAFRKLDSQVWVWSMVEQQATAVERGAPIDQAVWSGTEDLLAYTVGSGIVHLRVLDAPSGESSILLAPDADGFPAQIAWDPTGERLAYRWSDFDVSTGTLFDELRIMPADGGDPIKLLDADVMVEGSLHLAGWSRQGDRLLFWYGPRLIDSFIPDTVALLSLAADGTETEPWLEQDALSWLYGRFLTPDVYTVGTGPDWQNKRIWLDGEARTPAGQVAVMPALSPDGAWLAYSAMPEQGEIAAEAVAQTLAGRHIWVVPAAGDADPRQLTADPAFRDEYPQWSANSGSILFARLDADDQASLWLIPAGGGEPDRVMDSLSSISSGHGIVTQVDWQRMLDWHR